MEEQDKKLFKKEVSLIGFSGGILVIMSFTILLVHFFPKETSEVLLSAGMTFIFGTYLIYLDCKDEFNKKEHKKIDEEFKVMDYREWNKK